jgi:hypothetical protein
VGCAALACCANPTRPMHFGSTGCGTTTHLIMVYQTVQAAQNHCTPVKHNNAQKLPAFTHLVSAGTSTAAGDSSHTSWLRVEGTGGHASGTAAAAAAAELSLQAPADVACAPCVLCCCGCCCLLTERLLCSRDTPERRTRKAAQRGGKGWEESA